MPKPAFPYLRAASYKSCFSPDPEVLGHHNLKNSSRTSLAPAGTSVWAHQAPRGAKDSDDHAAYIQEETCLSPPTRVLCSRPDCSSTHGVPGVTGLHSGTVSQKEGRRLEGTCLSRSSCWHSVAPSIAQHSAAPGPPASSHTLKSPCPTLPPLQPHTPQPRPT